MSVQWIFEEPFSFEDKKFARIYRFFVIEPPLEDTSKRAKLLNEYGWSQKKITIVLKKQIPSLNKNWKTISAEESKNLEEIEQDVKNLCKKNKILDEVSERREVFIHRNMKKHKTKSLVYTIRCAFAHGAFNKKEYFGEQFYFFENRHKNKLLGRIVVKEETLLKIIEIIENPKTYEK